MQVYTTPAAFKNHVNSCSASKLDLWESFRLLKESREVTADSAQVADVASGSNTGTSGSELAPNDPSQDSSATAMEEYIDAHLATPPPAKRRRKAAKVFTDGNFVSLADIDIQPDMLPAPLIAITENDVQAAEAVSDGLETATSHGIFDTPANVFGLFRRYKRLGNSTTSDNYSTAGRHDPDSLMNLNSMSDISIVDIPSAPDSSDIYSPFPNKSSFLLSEWFWNRGAQKSKESFRDLLHILGNEDFSTADVTATNWPQIDRQLGLNDWDREEWQDDDAGWQESSILISVPFHRFTDNPGARDYTINGFYHRTLTSVIREKLTLKREDASNFHLEPYELLWQPDDNQPPLPLYGELYTSQAFLSAHQTLQESPPEPGCNLPRVVVALMFWSDATHLTQFGNAKITPLYMYFGNESKYRRCKPSCRLAEHVAFFQQLPDSFKDFANNWTGDKKVSPELLAHCKRELAHEQWRILLDGEFLEAYEHGIVLDWIGDGKKRRFYPRFMTYSADYPEKVLMSTIRQLGGCPCPRCKMPKKKLHLIGTDEDMAFRIQSERRDDDDRRQKVTRARTSIYGSSNFAVDSAPVERELKPESLVPTLNAFSDRLSRFGLHWPSMFVVDLLHEIELGVFKALLVHLLRILESVDENLVHELDRRFRATPTFGRDTIRRFTTNASELKKMAAHNYEDILQCIIPVFDGLLSDEEPNFLNTRILRILFQLAYWHGLAKLRLHSEATLRLLDEQTTILGACLREFQTEICPLFLTKELRREAVARERRTATKEAGTSQKSKKGANKAASPGQTAPVVRGLNVNQEPAQAEVVEGIVQHQDILTTTLDKGKQPDSRRKNKTFNLNTYKVHSMGDYSSAIRTFGTTDSYSTETGELEHRVPKSNYKRTSKKQFQRQLARIERKQTRIHRMRQAMSGTSVEVADMSADNASLANPAIRYHIGASEHNKQDIRILIRDNTNDPAITDFYPKLKTHLLPRLKAKLNIPIDLNITPDPRSPDQERLFYKNDAIYQHNILRINYTTYDIRRLQDVVNPRTDHRDIMILRQPMIPGKHEYRYGRVIGIYHVNAIYHGPSQHDLNQSHRLDFVWVRWFEMVEGYDRPASVGWSGERLGLDQLTFPPIGSVHAFGFLDPADILRGCHITPRFRSMLRHTDGLGLSGIARDKHDWSSYYVNRFVDRDMLMRFHWSMGVGHLSHPQRAVSLPSDADRSGGGDRTTGVTSSLQERLRNVPQPALAIRDDKAAINDDESSSDSGSDDMDYSSESVDGEGLDGINSDFDDMYGYEDDIGGHY
ncbi:hypothetical protein DXG01_001205 [Tephrocybe rancida]|nr:hypothetical protein DXG01_001205 [Tephrocybe rancida]